jgi:hypothetical protein
MKMIMRALVFSALAFAFAPVTAQAQTCSSMAAKCRAECPAAMKVGAPAGCTCAERHATCKQTKVWPSWRGGPGLPVKG